MLYLKKRPVQKVVNRTTPEERKAYRKRVVLSNPNALDVPGLPVLGQKAVALAEEEEAKEAEAEAEDINGGYNHDYGTIRVGAMVALPSGIVEQLRELRTFKPKQRWGAFRRPAVLWTDASVAIAREIARIDSQRTPSSSPSPETSTNPSTLRRIITGERGVGKSTLLLQAMSLALSRGWVVVSIPECGCHSLFFYISFLFHDCPFRFLLFFFWLA
jgi:small subunit ribosomal protein S29